MWRAARRPARRAIVTRPAVGRSTPQTTFSSVVLPEPLGPISPSTSPLLASSETPSSARTPRNCLATSSTTSGDEWAQARAGSGVLGPVRAHCTQEAAMVRSGTPAPVSRPPPAFTRAAVHVDSAPWPLRRTRTSTRPLEHGPPTASWPTPSDAAGLGELRPGDRLPPERALAERLGVGRMTVRHALRELGAEGLLVTPRDATGGRWWPTSRGCSRRRGAGHGALRRRAARELRVPHGLEPSVARLAAERATARRGGGLRGWPPSRRRPCPCTARWTPASTSAGRGVAQSPRVGAVRARGPTCSRGPTRCGAAGLVVARGDGRRASSTTRRSRRPSRPVTAARGAPHARAPRHRDGGLHGDHRRRGRAPDADRPEERGC